MFLNLMNQFFLINLMMSTLIGLSSNSWAMCWIMLELNLMMFVPLLILSSSSSSASNPIKYFLVQSMGSIIFFFGFVWMVSNKFMLILMDSSSLVIISMAIKSGIPPFHFWFPQLLENSQEIQAILLLTLQKLIPFSFMSYCLSESLFLLILISGLVGCLGGFNQNSLMKIMAYSSMVHGSWLMTSLLIGKTIFSIYFLIYSFISISMMIIFKKFMLKKISDSSKFISSPSNKFIFSFNLMSLGGMPPLLGFFNKLMVIMSLNSMKMFVLTVFLLFYSLISLIYYIRVSFLGLTKFFFSFKEKSLNFNTGFIWLLILSLSANMLIPILILISF